MKPGSLFSELQRRHVLRVVGAYAVAAWVAVEVYTTIQPILLARHAWTTTYVVLLAILGFPVVFALAWVFDVTPQGVRRTESLDQVEPATSHALAGRRHLSARATGFFGLGVLVALIAFAAYAGVENQPRNDDAPITSIAVLPFADLSSTGDQAFLSDGIAEELLNRLTQVQDLDVPARTSSFAFRDRNADVREIGRRLGVQTVLEGSVRREGDRVRVQARLIDVADGFQLWSDSYEAAATDVFALQDQISEAIVDALRVRIAPTPEAGERGTRNALAMEQYLLGLQRWHLHTDRDLRQSLTHLEAAVAADSAFALAHAALAQTYALLPAYGDFPVDSAVMRGSAAAARAIDLDPSLGDAYAAMGQIAQNYEWDLQGAERFYRRALGYNPGDPTAHQWYAETLLLLGRVPEARSHVEKVLDANPMSPAAAYIDVYLTTLHGSLHDAAAASRLLITRHPDFEPAAINHAYIMAAAGLYDDAAAAVDRLAVMVPQRTAIYGTIAAALRDPALRSDVARELEASTLPSSERAAWLVALGDIARAAAVLRQGFDLQDDVNLLLVLPHPLLAPLRADDVVRSMIEDIGIVLPA